MCPLHLTGLLASVWVKDPREAPVRCTGGPWNAPVEEDYRTEEWNGEQHQWIWITDHTSNSPANDPRPLRIYTHVTVWNVVALGICAAVERYGEDGNGEQLRTADEPTD